VVVLGDTCDASNIAHLAENCDLLIHEVTMVDSMKSKAFQRGHSTASMAGNLFIDYYYYMERLIIVTIIFDL
jgi:ribonuclease BN (tRNA processing enzyme)